MTKELFAALMLSTVAVLFTPSFAHACSCLPPDLARSYNSADDVIAVKVYKARKQDRTLQQDNISLHGDVTYVGRVLRGFKGCLAEGDKVFIKSAISGAACGMTLKKGFTYYLNGRRDARKSGWHPVVHINSCDYNLPLDALTKQDWRFLETRLNCCGDECVCNDGTRPVQCFVDPCEVNKCDEPDAQCVANYCGGCNAEFFDQTGAQVCRDECVTDRDCAADSWCRPDEAGVGQCVPFAGPGQSCDGFVLPWYRERCAEGLICVPVEPTGDAPGICATCNVDGTAYQAGESFPAGDGCNTCTCTKSGAVACTKIACPPLCEYDGTTYKRGATFTVDDGCNQCVCLDDGTVICAPSPCPPFCEYRGVLHESGVSFTAVDGCNLCECGPHGKVICSMRPCVYQLKPELGLP